MSHGAKVKENSCQRCCNRKRCQAENWKVRIDSYGRCMDFKTGREAGEKGGD
jgi:hypothetical protein